MNDELNSPGCADVPRRLAWRIIDRQSDSTNAVFDDLTLNIGARANLALKLTLGARLPAGLPLPGSGTVMRLGFSGEVAGSVAGHTPVRLGAVGAGVASQAGLELDYFLARGGNRPVGAVLAAALSELPRPYDLRGLAREMQTRRVLGLSLRAHGRVAMSGQLQVGPSLELVRGIGAGADLGVAMQVSEAGTFQLSVRPSDADDMRANAVRVDLQRVRGRLESSGFGLRVGLDTGSLFRRIRPQLLGGVSQTGLVLETLEDWLPTSRTLARRLQDVAVQQAQRSSLRRLMTAGLGQRNAGDPGAAFGALLLQQIDVQEAIWTGAAEDHADALAHAVLAVAPSTRPRAMPWLTLSCRTWLASSRTSAPTSGRDWMPASALTRTSSAPSGRS